VRATAGGRREGGVERYGGGPDTPVEARTRLGKQTSLEDVKCLRDKTRGAGKMKRSAPFDNIKTEKSEGQLTSRLGPIHKRAKSREKAKKVRSDD